MTTARALLVISHYDCRPLRDLYGLLKSLEDHSAGREFDVCIVVNQESGRPIEITRMPFAVTVLSRPNVGMNIGAWDHGWRENPGYDYYIFLQDECTILRNEWLQPLVDCLTEPSVGIVGECINHRWCKTWPELTVATSPSEPREAARSLAAKRAYLCLQLMQARNIPAGDTARHLRSLIWGLSGEVLQKLDGFPIGRDYDECIAAEIAVSRQIEGLGLSVRQAHRIPFYYVGHSQWIRTYPGFSASLSYTDWARKHFSALSFPFPSFVGKGDTTSRIDQLVKRVETERGLFNGGVVNAPRHALFALLVVFIDRAPADKDLVLTALSWCLQSAPDVDLIFVAADEFLRNKLKAWMARPEYEDFSQIQVCLRAEWLSYDLESCRFLFFARPGDQFHPSVASMVTILDTTESPDIVVWNEKKYRRSEPGAWLLRQPNLEPFTIRTLGHIGMAFAVRPRSVREFPHDFADDLLNNDSHLFHLWLVQNPQIRWITHPEFMGSRSLHGHTSPEVSPPAHDAYRTTYREILNRTGDFEIPSGNGHRRCALIPTKRAQSASVIVSFRDRPRETMACLQSLLGQQLTGRLEVVLINNRSQDKCVAEVRRCIDMCRDAKADVRLIDYDGPFNHSRQTNLGVRNSSGDVLVFLNNDAELMESGVLEEMAAWAILPGIGTVGCQVVGPRDQLLSAGIQARPGMPELQSSPVEECREAAHSGHVREVLANTFACAAIARSKFDKVGWLNETEFPNGYNDVDYCLRVTQRGFRNLYLGHLQVRHTPGTSRGRCDETFQKVLLRRRYPELSVRSMFQLSYEWRPADSNIGSAIGEEAARLDIEVIPSSSPTVRELARPITLMPAANELPRADEAPLGLKKALKVLYKAMIYWVQRRILRTA